MPLTPVPDYKTCMFCGTQGPLTKEHIWGAWTLQVYPPPDAKPGHGHHKVSFRDEKAQVLYRDGLFARPGDPLAQTTRVVCRKCNNGWMSTIEDRMKATFRRIFLNRDEVISSQDISAILNWSYLKTCLHFRALGDRHSDSQTSTLSIFGQAQGSVFIVPDLPKRLASLEAVEWAHFSVTYKVPADFRVILARGRQPLKHIGGKNLHYQDRILTDGSMLKSFYLHFMSLGDMQLVATNWPVEIPEVANDLLGPREQRFFTVLTPSTSEAHLPTVGCIAAQDFDKIVAVFFTRQTGFKAPLMDDSYPVIP